MLKETHFIITFCSSAARSLKWLYLTESDKLLKSVDYLKHEIFDDPVELAPFVALALWLFGKLYKILDSLEINERYNLGQIESVSSQTFGTVFPNRPISILPAASPPMVMSNQTL